MPQHPIKRWSAHSWTSTASLFNNSDPALDLGTSEHYCESYDKIYDKSGRRHTERRDVGRQVGVKGTTRADGEALRDACDRDRVDRAAGRARATDRYRTRWN